MRSYLLSMLQRTFKDANADAFVSRYANDWLVWEPGAWKPPGRSTLVPGEGTPAPVKGEALALALVERSDRPQLTLGRGSECDAPINDGTLSQIHLVFMRTERGTWTVRDANSRNGTKVGEKKLEPGQPLELRDGDTIHAAQVTFTFCSPQRLFERLGEGAR
ncbi:MAG: FHA domain-containing protein [Myxococcales bacterium]|nr:FHA domain-containing protein [Myxococcales bacterium]